MNQDAIQSTTTSHHFAVHSSPEETLLVEEEFQAWMLARQQEQQESIPVIWGRYVRRLRVSARALLIAQSMGERDHDNVAFRAANAMFEATGRRELDNMDHTSDLWKILLIRAAGTIQLRQRSAGQSCTIASILADEPSAKVSIHFVEELEQLVRSRLDDGLRRVAFLRLEGCPNTEIAERLGQQEAEIEPQLVEIRQRCASRNV